MPMSGCSDQGGGEPQHYLKLTGGGIVFNYRIANTYAGVLVSAERALPEGAIVEHDRSKRHRYFPARPVFVPRPPRATTSLL
jgi:hypothetical protein